jgi:hypothetical protein
MRVCLSRWDRPMVLRTSPCQEVTKMTRTQRVRVFLAALLAILILPHMSAAAEDDHIKWYGFGGELTDPHRWFGRIGITEDLGAEIIFAMKHESDECGDQDQHKDCDFTRLDVGAGFVYDFAPANIITPYVAGRFILTMTDNSDSETSGTVEAAGGVEYVIMKRLGLSGELNFSFGTNPTRVMTTTRVRFCFYL